MRDSFKKEAKQSHGDTANKIATADSANPPRNDSMESVVKEADSVPRNDMQSHGDSANAIISQNKQGNDMVTPQQILETLNKWDYSSQTQGSKKQRFSTNRVSDEEAQKIRNKYHLKGKKPLMREIDSHQVAHTLKSHGNEIIETARGNIAITKEDIANYEYFTQNYDIDRKSVV